ncbi:PQQ-dependent sugar dehydrogenase [Verrucosispora sp. TAA-831]|uniref:PQQ-dependent sugar dehydrogenase n=1 Tax=Verrucosispora sp. TAA-831 TaxID=3422227 RepID=UPI003D6E5153
MAAPEKSENSAITHSLNGKILRIATEGSIPEDNPGDSPVYSSGHHNVQGIAFGPVGGPSGAASRAKSHAGPGALTGAMWPRGEIS